MEKCSWVDVNGERIIAAGGGGTCKKRPRVCGGLVRERKRERKKDFCRFTVTHSGCLAAYWAVESQKGG